MPSEFDIEEQCHAIGLSSILSLAKLLKEHAFERVKLCLLVGTEVIEVGVVDDVQTVAELIGILVMTLRLFAKFQERFLNFDVGQRVYPAELADTNIR